MNGHRSSPVERSLELNDIGIWEVDERGCTTFVNEPMAAMIGYRRDEIVGQAIAAFMDVVSAARTQRSLEERDPGVRPMRRTRLRHSDGHHIDVLVFAARVVDSAGRYQGASAVVIPERGAAPNSDVLAALSGRGEELLEPADELTGSWELQVDSGRVEWSSEIFAIFGVDQASFRPSFESAMALVHPIDRPFIERTVEAAIASGKAYSTYFRAIRPDGSLRIVHARGHVKQNLRSIVGTMQDLTNRVSKPGGVSARQREVLDLMAQGLTNEEIGNRLSVSPETVRTHIQHAIEKLGAHNRVHAVVLALRNGEIEL